MYLILCALPFGVINYDDDADFYHLNYTTSDNVTHITSFVTHWNEPLRFIRTIVYHNKFQNLTRVTFITQQLVT